jgi:hypothetical protein
MNEEKKNDYGTLIAKKAERLVTALYLVTDLISDLEPIKHTVRKNAVTLLSSMNALAQLEVKDRLTEFKVSLRSVTEIISLLHVSVTTGIVSEMNGSILMEGFRTLQSALEKKQPIFTREMLAVENEEQLTEGKGFSSAITSSSYDAITPLSIARLHDNQQELRRTEDSLRHAQILAKLEQKENKGQNTQKEENKKDIIKDTGREHKEHTPHATIMAHNSGKQNIIPTTSFQMRKQSRRDQILALFVKGVDVSIKDIAIRIRGCSEKTIQRELNALVYDNVIERIGEKRWSRYILR